MSSWDFPNADKSLKEPWFYCPVGEAHDAVITSAKELKTQVGDAHRSRCLDLLALYQGQDAEGSNLYESFEDGLSYNVIESCSDTLISHVFANKVNPYFLTSKGSKEDKDRAKGMQRAVEGQFSAAGIYGPLGEDICSDGVIFGEGYVYPWADIENLRVVYERVLPWNVLVSPVDAKTGSPRNLFMVTPVARELLLAAYPDQREAIMAAPRAEREGGDPFFRDNITDQVLVYRAWHLPSSHVDRDEDKAWGYEKDGEDWKRIDPGHDGRAVLAIEGRTISDEVWPYDYFPIARFTPRRSRLGFRGRGIPETLVAIQYEITIMLQRIAAIMQLHAVPIVYLWAQSGVNPYKLATNDYSRIIVGRQPAGSAIQYITPQSVPAEYIAQLQRLIEFAYRLSGISEMSASSKKPAGIEAGVALQMLADTESIRHTTVFRGWERFHTDLGAITIDAFRVLAEEAKIRGKDFALTWMGDKELQRIAWDDVDLPEMRYRLTVSPTNLLPRTPAARLQRVTEMVANGMIAPQKAMKYLDAPDFEEEMEGGGAFLRNAERKIQLAVDGEMEAAFPSPYDELPLLILTARERLADLEVEGADEAALERVRQLIKLAVAEQKKLAPPPPPLPPGAPPGPGAVAGPVPPPPT